MLLKYKNISVFYTDEGKGKTIILLHGFLENSTMWKDIKPTLVKNHRVICIDLLGHGETQCLGYVHTMEDQAKMIFHVLNHLKLRRYKLIGHSMGGYVALAFSKLYTKNIKSLCLLNSTFETDSIERKQLRKRAIKMVQTNYKNLVRMSFTNLFAENSKTQFKTEINTALNEALKTPVQGYIAASEGMILRHEFETFFAKAPFNKTIILGEKDWIVNSKKLQNFALKHNIPAVVLSEGHMSHIENKTELSIALKDFAKNG